MPNVPLTTGQVSRLLSIPEQQLQDRIRRGLIVPAPPVHMGRRWWDREHVAAAASLFAVTASEKPTHGR